MKKEGLDFTLLGPTPSFQGLNRILLSIFINVYFHVQLCNRCLQKKILRQMVTFHITRLCRCLWQLWHPRILHIYIPFISITFNF